MRLRDFNSLPLRLNCLRIVADTAESGDKAESGERQLKAATKRKTAHVKCQNMPQRHVDPSTNNSPLNKIYDAQKLPRIRILVKTMIFFIATIGIAAPRLCAKNRYKLYDQISRKC